MREEPTKRTRTILTAAVIPIALCTGLWLRYACSWESPVERVYRLCGECGLAPAEVDGLIDDARDSGLDREGMLELFYATFEDRADAELCEPCAEAVSDAARNGPL